MWAGDIEMTATCSQQYFLILRCMEILKQLHQIFIFKKLNHDENLIALLSLWVIGLNQVTLKFVLKISLMKW
jgi:hypothetical protein